MKAFDLVGKTAVVVGGGTGIGFSIAQTLGRAGAAVVISSRSRDAGQRAVATMKAEGLEVSFVPIDVTSLASIDEHVSRVLKSHQRVDVLVNSAGAMSRKPAEEIEEQDWDWVMDVNAKGVFFTCQRVGRAMISTGKGSIINISSLRSRKMGPNRSVYAISKAAVSNLTRALAYEWGKYGVRVNAIAPGTTITEFNREHFENNPDELARIVSTIPLGRPGDVGDYGSAALYLASDASSFVTGQTLFVDGGTSNC